MKKMIAFCAMALLAVSVFAEEECEGGACLAIPPPAAEVTPPAPEAPAPKMAKRPRPPRTPMVCPCSAEDCPCPKAGDMPKGPKAPRGPKMAEGKDGKPRQLRGRTLLPAAERAKFLREQIAQRQARLAKMQEQLKKLEEEAAKEPAPAEPAAPEAPEQP